MSSNWSENCSFREGREEARTSFNAFEEAMRLKEEGCFSEACAILERSCNPPSIYKGHYRELFKLWRQMNRQALKDGQFEVVVSRVKKMIRYDDQMIAKMLAYWSDQQGRKLPSDYFDRDRNLKISDARALARAAAAIRDDGSFEEANTLSRRFQDTHGKS